MVKLFKEKVASFLVEILTAIVFSVAAFLWTFNVAIATSEVKIETNTSNIKEIQQLIETIRTENRKDHEEILKLLMKK